jgi:hypothetical protein
MRAVPHVDAASSAFICFETGSISSRIHRSQPLPIFQPQPQGVGFQDLRLGRAELWRRLLHQPTQELLAQAAGLLAPSQQRPAHVPPS